ncbi:MAG: WD40 repeat domain-containing serine/threonine-protein kinase [Planctomycetes bacterium]|nr:WD40 repeat domain-containing serine/threonine-protein kinase [Planctomycetota bacterium]
MTPLTPGQRLGQYVVEDVIGRGGMGVVYRARDERLGRVVALKTIAAGEDPRLRERFAREVRAAAAVTHEHVVRVWSVGEAGGRPVLVQDYVPGGSLADRLRAAGPLPWRDAARLGAQVARGLAAIHAAGVIHRDLKPANVLLDARGAARITDFGLARRADGTAQALTRTGELVGTLEYLAPEQAGDAGDVGPPADLYALGGILFSLLTARPPFDGHGATLVHKHLTAAPRPPSALALDVPPALDALVLRLLRKAPADRPASADEVAAGLEALLAPPPAPARCAPWLLLAAAGAALAVFAASLAAALAPVPPRAAAPATRRPAAGDPRRADDDGLAAVRRRFPSSRRLRRERALGGLELKTPGRAAAAAVLDDGRLVVVGRALHVFDPEGGRELAAAACPGGAEACAVLPGGRLITVGEAVLLWDLARLEVIARLPAADGRAADHVVASGDGARVLVGARAPQALDGRTGASLAALAPSDRYLSAALSHDGAAAFLGSTDGRALSWDLAGQPVEVASLDAPVTALAPTPDARWLLAGLQDGRVFLLERPGGRVAGGVDAGAGQVLRLAASPDSTRAVVAIAEDAPGGSRRRRPGVARLLSISPGGGLRAGPALEGHAYAVSAAAFTPDGRRVLTTSADRSARLFDAETGAQALAPRGHAGLVAKVAPSPDGRLLATGGQDGTLRLWDVASGAERACVRAHADALQALAWEPDGRGLLTAGLDEVSLWDVAGAAAPRRRARVAPLGEDEARVTTAALAGERVLIGTDRFVRLWDPAGEAAELMPLLHETHVRAAVAAGGREVLAGMTNGWLLRLGVGPDALATGPSREQAPLAGLLPAEQEHPQWARVMTEVAVGGRGLLAGVLWDGRLVFWRVGAPAPVTTATGQDGVIRGLAVEPRERLAASASDDGAVRLWSPQDGALLDTLRLRADLGEFPCGVAFSPDGARLFVGTSGGVVLVLEVVAPGR